MVLGINTKSQKEFSRRATVDENNKDIDNVNYIVPIPLEQNSQQDLNQTENPALATTLP
jgi:hypothetical protein